MATKVNIELFTPLAEHCTALFLSPLKITQKNLPEKPQQRYIEQMNASVR